MTKGIGGTLFAVASLFAATAAQAEVFDASIAEQTVRLGLQGSLAKAFGWEKGDYDVGAIYGDVEDDHHQNFFAGHLGLMLTGDAGAQSANVKAGLGARVEYIHGEDDDGASLAIGGQLRVSMPGYERLAFQGWGWYGPNASTFGDLDKYSEFGVSVGYEILKDAEAYVGYRWIDVSPEHYSGDVSLEDGANIGIRLRF